MEQFLNQIKLSLKTDTENQLFKLMRVILVSMPVSQQIETFKKIAVAHEAGKLTDNVLAASQILQDIESSVKKMKATVISGGYRIEDDGDGHRYWESKDGEASSNFYEEVDAIADAHRDLIFKKGYSENSKVVSESSHILYKKGDTGIPEQILDRNGDIALNCCKLCGEFEAGLENQCIPPLLDVCYMSNWQEGVVYSRAKLKLENGEIVDIESSDDGSEYEHHRYDEISIKFNGEEHYFEVEDDSAGYFVSSTDLEAIKNLTKTEKLEN